MACDPRRAAFVLTAMPRPAAGSGAQAPFRVLELNGALAGGWYEIAVRIGGAPARIRLLVGTRAHLLPAARRGRAVILVEVPEGERLHLEVTGASGVEMGAITARKISSAEALLRRGGTKV